jgi:hypothetical protein
MTKEGKKMRLTELQLRTFIRKSLLTEINSRFDIAEKDLPTKWKDKMKENNWTWKRGVGFMGKPDNKGARKPIKSASAYGGSTIGYISASHANPYMYDRASEFPGMKREEGKMTKKSFAEVYKKNKSFFDSFTYIHWTGNLEKTLETNKKHELSCMFYDEPPFIADKAGVGVELKGWVTAMANVNMFSGYSSAPSLDFGDKDFMDDISYESSLHRHKSSGHNKYPVTRRALEIDAEDYGSKAGLILSPDDIDYGSIDRARRGGKTWGDSNFAQLNNEALVDNWKPKRIILTRHSSGEERKAVATLAKKYKLEIVDEDGKAVLDSKLNPKSAKSLQDELDRIEVWDKKSKSKEKPKLEPVSNSKSLNPKDSEAEDIAALEAGLAYSKKYGNPTQEEIDSWLD